MLEKYNDFIINVLGLNNELNNSSIDLVNNLTEVDKGLYIARVKNEDFNYQIIISLVDNDISINSIVSRVYITDSFEGMIKESYTTLRVDRYVKYDTGIYHGFKLIQESTLENEFSSKKEMYKENNGNKFYEGNLDFDSLFVNGYQKIKK